MSEDVGRAIGRTRPVTRLDALGARWPLREIGSADQNRPVHARKRGQPRLSPRLHARGSRIWSAQPISGPSDALRRLVQPCPETPPRPGTRPWPTACARG